MSKPLVAYVEGIGLVGPGLAGWQASQGILAGHEAYQPQKAVIPPSELLPPAERRRCSDLVKLSLAISSEAVAMGGIDVAALPSVFTSSHGDGLNCDAICEVLASDDRDISPTRFHNSVHNAPAGYWSIATGSMGTSSVLCGFDASFGAGLLEALTQVTVDGTRCILMAIDTDAPEQVHNVRPNGDLLGIALVLAPEQNGHSIARISVTFTKDAAGRFEDAALEQLRLAIPSARGLPLLSAIATNRAGRVVLDYLDSRIAVDVSPC